MSYYCVLVHWEKVRTIIQSCAQTLLNDPLTREHKRSQHVLKHQSSPSHHMLLSRGRCTGEIWRPKLPLSLLDLGVPSTLWLRQKRRSLPLKQLISACPLQVLQSTGYLLLFLLGDRPLTKRHQLGPFYKCTPIALHIPTKPETSMARKEKMLGSGTMLISTTQAHGRTYHQTLQLKHPWNSQGSNHLNPVLRKHVGSSSHMGLLAIEDDPFSFSPFITSINGF